MTRQHALPSWPIFTLLWCAITAVGALVMILVGELFVVQTWGGPADTRSSLDEFIYGNVPLLPMIGGVVLSSVQWLILRRFGIRPALWVGGNIIIWGILSLAAHQLAICLLFNVLLGPILAWHASTKH